MNGNGRALVAPSVSALADELAQSPGVVGVVLGGSRAYGAHRPDADFDLGLYYEPSNFDWERVVPLLVGRDDARAPRGLAGPGSWGPWMNGGGWLTVDGRQVDILLRDIVFVEGVIDEAASGRFSSNYLIGHPHGWHSFMVLGWVHYNCPIAGAVDRLNALQRKTVPYPSALRTAVVDRFLFEARFTSILVRKLDGRHDPTQRAGLVYRSVMCLVQTLYAANEAYVVNEKAAVDGTTRLARVPRDFASRAHALATPSLAPQAEQTDALIALVDEVEGLVRDHWKLDTSWGDTSFPDRHAAR